VIVIAVASGTSADGVDIGVFDLRWADRQQTVEVRVIDTVTRPWPGRLREEVLALLPPAATTAAEICRLDTLIGRHVARAVSDAQRAAGRGAELVVSPGQTVHHEVVDGRCEGTLQLGQPAWVAELTGLPVISDLRARDVAAGGHGAPLASTLDALWLAADAGRRAGLNLGGIANVTVVGEGEVVAWDTGPANCLLDLAAARVSDGADTHDRDGLRALRGAVHEGLLKRLLAHPYFGVRPPVSTGRETFSAGFLADALAAVGAVEDDDLLATLTELSAVSVADALRPYRLSEVVVSGGGVRNPALVAALRRALDPVPLVSSDVYGLPPGAKETAMWALLGFLTWYGTPASTLATGSAGPRLLGRISPGLGPLRLPDPVAVPPLRLRAVDDAAGEGQQ